MICSSILCTNAISQSKKRCHNPLWICPPPPFIFQNENYCMCDSAEDKTWVSVISQSICPIIPLVIHVIALSFSHIIIPFFHCFLHIIYTQGCCGNVTGEANAPTQKCGPHNWIRINETTATTCANTLDNQQSPISFQTVGKNRTEFVTIPTEQGKMEFSGHEW